MKTQILWIVPIAFLVTSCATTKTTTPSTTETKPSEQVSWESREQTLSKIQSWKVNGKIAVQSAKDSGSASVDWMQRSNSYNISLMGPLGSNGLKLSGRPGNVTLVTSDGKHYTANNPEQLLKERWGFHVPVSNMKYWIRGIPVANVPSTTHFDAQNRLTDLTQQGWHVEYQGYTKSGSVDLPSKMSISSPSLKVKIVVYQWSVGA